MKQGFAIPAYAGSPPRRRRRFHSGGSLAPLIVALAALVVVAGCGAGSGAGARGPDAPAELRVFAASSLTEAFTALGDQFMASHPHVRVVFSFTGSQALVAQIQQGAPADVLACADSATLASVADLVGSPQTFASNALTIIVPAGNPMNVRSLTDLARPDVKVVLAAPEVPAGRYAAQILEEADVAVEPVSLEEAAKGVVTKVALDEADAGIAYLTDVRAAGSKAEGIALPADQNVTAVYPIATVKSSVQGALAQEFVDLVLSADGQKTLREHGFLPSQIP